ncbi:hypothetical protein [Ruania zhangjianzhongii]|uniref:hypothetical protein n=1 Tax=Ruania zhangjianzhongii TaxID=2603206 RepID=UPI0011C911EA|nr:hypothetical protein [Ruania zhangjianzhongii]
MSHLGPLVSSLVDGHLAPAKAERAYAHLVCCAGCRAQVQAERALREAAARSADEVHASADLTRKLLAMNLPGQTSGPLSAGAATEGSDGSPRSGRGARLRVVSGAVASVGVFTAALFVLGGQQREVDDLTPLVAPDRGTDSRSAAVPSAAITPVTSGSDGLSATVLDWMNSSGWSAPADLPHGMSVQDVLVTGDAEAGTQILQIDLAGSRGTVQVMEARGMLDADTTAPLEPVLVGGHEVFQVADHWWVAQCGDSVVAVSSGADPAAAHELLARMPAGTEDGVVDRLAQGVHVLLGSG